MCEKGECMPIPDFIRIDGEAIRLTSITRDGETMTVVVMMRGARDHERLVELLRASPVTVALPDEEPRAMAVASDQVTSTGEGPRTIFRHAIALGPARSPHGQGSLDEPLDQRLARIEEKLDRVLALLERNAAPG